MTIEEINAAALKATLEGDFETLEAMVIERQRAIEELIKGEPSEEKASRIRNAINAGEFLQRDLREIRMRIGSLQRFNLPGSTFRSIGLSA
jgi:hypothetical protein